MRSAEDQNLIDALALKLNQACDIIENTRKREAVDKLTGKVNIDIETLYMKSLDELRSMVSVADLIKPPSFISGTPISHDKPSPRDKLDSMFTDNMAKLYGDRLRG